jgi:acetoin utilization protein AcuB
MNVGDIMTARVVTVELDDSLKVIKELFDSARFRHLLVVDSGRLLQGVISDRDLLRAVSPHLGTLAETARDLSTLNKHAHQIMTRHPITLSKEAHVNDAVALFREHLISCIPIVDAKGSPVGIVSLRDMLRIL